MKSAAGRHASGFGINPASRRTGEDPQLELSVERRAHIFSVPVGALDRFISPISERRLKLLHHELLNKQSRPTRAQRQFTSTPPACCSSIGAFARQGSTPLWRTRRSL